MNNSNTCKVNRNQFNPEEFPSYKSWISEFSDVLTLSTSKKESKFSSQEQCGEQVYDMDVCKKHYDLYWTFVIGKEHDKCPIDKQQIDFEFIKLKNFKNMDRMFGLLFRIESITATVYTFSYSEFNTSQKTENEIVKETIQKVKDGEEISISNTDCLPLIFRYSNEVLYFEKHRKTPMDNFHVKIRKIAFPKKEMEKQLTKLLDS